MVAKWAPPTEKGKFVAALNGGSLGTVLTWPMLGAIIESIGWYWSFFIPGIICIVWCIGWYYLVSNTPDEHTRISDEEKIYITKATIDSVQRVKVRKNFSSMEWLIYIFVIADLTSVQIDITVRSILGVSCIAFR